MSTEIDTDPQADDLYTRDWITFATLSGPVLTVPTGQDWRNPVTAYWETTDHYGMVWHVDSHGVITAACW